MMLYRFIGPNTAKETRHNFGKGRSRFFLFYSRLILVTERFWCWSRRSSKANYSIHIISKKKTHRLSRAHLLVLQDWELLIKRKRRKRIADLSVLVEKLSNYLSTSTRLKLLLRKFQDILF